MGFGVSATERLESAGYVRVLDAARVAICANGSTEVVEWNEVIMARSAKNYTAIVTTRGTFTVRKPLQVVIDTLAGLGLVQIHRRVAVNEGRVRRLIRSGRRRLVVELESDLCLEAGRQFQRSVRTRFGAQRLVGSSRIDKSLS
jgi:DNA-binding LytR/AlgR family response regulator